MVKTPTKSKLVEIAADLQKKMGTRVDFDMAISFLIDQYSRDRIDWAKFDEFWNVEEGEQPRDMLNELYQERSKDEKRYRRD